MESLCIELKIIAICSSMHSPIGVSINLDTFTEIDIVKVLYYETTVCHHIYLYWKHVLISGKIFIESKLTWNYVIGIT